jgi:hypothetical protein
MCIVKLTSAVVVRYGIMNPLLGADIPTTLSVHPASAPLLLPQSGVNRAFPCVLDHLFFSKIFKINEIM